MIESRADTWTMLGLGAVLALHAAAVIYFGAPDIALSGAGPTADAHGLSRYLLERALDARTLGLPRFYDPAVMAGMAIDRAPASPAGPLGSIALYLSGFGVPVLSAYGGLTVVLHALVPGLALLFAWAAGLRRAEAVWVALAWSALWWLDSLFHWSWYSGRLGLSAATLLGPVPVALIVRSGSRARVLLGLGGFVALGLVAPLIALVLGVAILPAVAVRARLSSSAVEWLAAIGPVLAGSAVVALHGLGMGEPVGVVFASKASMLLTDLFDVLSDDYAIEGNVRTLLRTVILAAAAVGVARWGRADHRSRAIAPAVGVCLGLGYLGGYLPATWPVDPHVLIMTAALLATWPAAFVFARLWHAPRVGRGLVLIAAVAAAPRLARTVMNFVPELVPQRFVRSVGDLRVSPLAGPNERFPLYLGTSSVPEWYPVARDRLRGLGGRVLVLDRGLSTYLARDGGVPVIGPLALRYHRQVASDPGRPGALEADGLPRLLADHAVRWVVAFGPLGAVDRRANLLEPVEVHDAVRLYRVRTPTTRVAEGAARIAGSDRGGIDVVASGGDRLALRYWYDAVLACLPACTVRPPQEGADRPLLVVEAPPEHFRLHPSP